MNNQDISIHDPIEIAKGIYWVGKRNEHELEVNVYLRVFEGNNHKVNMLIDPGPSTDVDAISDKIEKVLGPDYKIHLAFINHQDPDVSLNAIYFQRHFPNMMVITSEDTWRLIRFFGLNSKKLIPIEKYKSRRVRLKTGHILIFVPTPYCHFRGSWAIYDETERVLMSGDLFGGLSETSDLYATEESWEGMKIFHQIYMPANIALKNAINNIRRLNVQPKIIAPQHGGVITGDLVNTFITKLEELEVGLDLDVNNNLIVESYLNAGNDILQRIKYKIDENIVKDTLMAFHSDGSFPEIIIFNKEEKLIGFNIALEDAFQMFIDKLIVGRSVDEQRQLRFAILDALTKWNIPSENFTIEAGDESGAGENALFESEQIEEEAAAKTSLPEIERLNVEKILKYLIEKGGGPDYSQLLIFRIMLKIPPEILKRNNVDSNEDLMKIEFTSDKEFAGFLIKAVENVLGAPLPDEILEA